ncbi:LOW QUALITY PROTEIN: intermembrane lipid transfer protein VPS13C [Boleophthalmus pectinirostris]|uniref:LOW QUALITY PROTEIN: intermembrane lipid transfer protein VPS13C n=1 Tax=Boleophthalmus pectinirostris TaxID=150288 RepID=UPI00242A7299|nr:LOW QUALITY PROTEIN: intermembrane lipid transfer protein VPS13C [Boleophthalmus pectinirostris]
MFEALVSDLLNRFIGDYVENLDKSQLKIGIWGGNVVLENLKVKENALSEFDVPFRVKAGQISKLTLKIPWKNLYSEAVVATLEGLYLLVVPGSTIKYDAAKEEKYQQELKQRELQRIEDALQMAARRASQTGDMLFNLETVVYKDPHVSKGHKKLKKHKKSLKKLTKRRDHSKGKSPPEEKKDTFVEKMATQVIKNLQVKISSIHLRYEDDVSDPQRPLSMGVTLSELSLQTTDENWKACILNEAAKIIYKLGSLECLCAYWNVPSHMFYKSSWENIIDQLKSGISTKTKEQTHYQYIFKPIFASAKMCINPNAEVELKTPKAQLQLEVQNIAIEMTKPQYLAMVDVLESIDSMVKNAPYRKFRPEVPVHTNAALWWRYAFSSIMEVHVRRTSKMWSWLSIRQHRETLKAYKNVYKTKLLNANKTSQDIEQNIQDLEKILDAFNITLIRQQAKMEVIRSGQKLVAKKSTGQKQGWFGGWFSKKAKKDEQEQEESKETEGSGLDDIMTPEEKQKLYTAIGYSGSSHNLTLPKEYVAVVVQFQLLRTSVTIREKPEVPEILKVQIIDLSTKISQRPGAQAVRLEATLQHWYVTGLQQQGAVPSLITSMGDSSSSLLNVVFEMNPEESAADQLLRVHSQPVEIIYDALTVNSMVDFFKTGKGVDLEVLTSATLSKLEEIKEKTASGLSHIIETRKVLDLKIDLKPSYLLLPKSGFYSKTSDLIIVDFGSLKLNSVEQSVLSPAPSSSLEEIMDRAYERFSVQLRKVQVLYSKSGDAWRAARQQSSSVQHVLRPMDFNLQLAKSMVDNDARMPKFKVSGELPLLHVKISDQKIQSLFELVDNIPLPNMGSAPSTPTDKVLSLVESRPRALNLQSAILPNIETDSEEDVSEKSQDEDHQHVPEELTEVQFKFEVKEVLLELTQQVDQERPVLLLSVCQLGAEGRKRSYDLSATAYLNKITLDYCDVPAGRSPLHLMRSSEQHGCTLLKVEYTRADPCGPSFQTQFANTEQTLKVEFSALDFLLHTKALLSTVNFMHSATPPKLRASAERDAKKQVEKTTQGKTVSKGAKDADIYSFKLFAMLGCFHVVVCDDSKSIADIRVQGIDASVVVQPKETEVFARLRDIVVTDVSPDTIHKKAVSIMGEEVFSFKMSLFPEATKGEGYRDMSKVDGKVTLRMGCIQIIYLHKFLMSMLMFIDNFQTAKEALSQATVQAAEKAASSVRDFAQKSFRLSMDIRLKAPLIIIPQDSNSHDALVMDLGLITVGNSFSLEQVEGVELPAVVEKMEVKLSQLKLSRLTQKQTVPDLQMLQPISFELLVTRNLCSSWFNKIPGIQVQGVLHSLNMSLGEEDLSLLMKILVHNIGEGSKVQRNLTQEKESDAPEQQQEVSLPWAPSSELTALQQDEMENAINLLLKFEIKEVKLTLKKPKDRVESPFLVLHASQLGIDTRVRKYDMCATVYLREIIMNCLEFKDAGGQDLCLVRSSAETGAELLKVQYFKADRNGPNFSSVFKNTEQMMNVMFTSLDLVLHTEALLSSINFLSAVMAPRSSASAERETRTKAEDKTVSTKSTALVSPVDNVIDLKVMATLGAFNVLVCDQKSNMADIKIQGINGSMLVQGPQTHISARLRDFIVLNVDPKCIHKKAISIVGDEVFSFSMSLTPNATEGASYADTSKSDGKVKLNVGCVQVVYLHKFIMSLLNFTNNFQTAKEALSQATVQAAEKAASSVRDFAQKSFRLSMDIRLKAPLIIIPQDSKSHDALVMDLGLITVGNSFSLQQVEGCPLPAVIDNMDVQLSQLKLSRASVGLETEVPSVELLEAVNLQLKVRRNLAPAWNKKMAAIEIEGDMKPMMVELSQSDLKVLLRILTENLGEADHTETSVPKQETGVQLRAPPTENGEKPAVLSPEELEGSAETLKFNFNIDSLGLVLYNNDPTKPSVLEHQKSLCLGQFALLQLRASGTMLKNGNMELKTVLTSCSLDDLRDNMERVTSRMLGRRDEGSVEPMIDLTLRRSGQEQEVVAELHKMSLCASVEFLMAVADFFVKAFPEAQSRPQSSGQGERLPLKQTTGGTSGDNKSGSVVRLRAVVVDPEVVFVASLMKADAPALVVSFQCDCSVQTTAEGGQNMTARLRELRVLACPFIRGKNDTAVTTVLRPCSVVLETETHPNKPLSGSVTVEEVIVKISPVILNTVMTITSAMTAVKPQAQLNQERKPDVTDLWSVMDIYSSNLWFLGVDQATEITENFRESDGSNEGEKFKAEVKVVQVTLESGLGHRTVPLLLAESSFSGQARNWSSLLHLNGDMTLEVNYFNEVHAVWEPLIERVDSGTRRWNLALEMKNNPVQDRSPVHGDEFVILPEPRTAVTICSKDTMNITVSQSCIQVLNNLAKEFSEGAASTYDYTLKEKPPFTIRNHLGIPLIVQHSANLRSVEAAQQGKLHELPVDQSMDLDYSTFEPLARGKLSALQRQESCLFNLSIVPSGYSEISNLPVDKPGRRLYNIRGPMLQEALSVLVQIDAAEGNKVITVRAPLQIRNHFSVPFTILKYCPSSRDLQPLGQAEPEKEFHIPLEAYRSQLFVRPAGPLEPQYGPSLSCVSWKEQVHRSSEVSSQLQCPSSDSGMLPLMVNTLAIPDELRHIANHGEQDWDPAYVIHLHPVATLRNLLPYTVRYLLESCADSFELPEGSTSDLLNARISGEMMSLVLRRYQGRDWHGHLRIQPDLPEFVSVSLLCDSDPSMSVDVSVHVSRSSARLLLSLFSPYWIINKTSRVLQYRAEDVSVKHPADCRDIILFSFKKKNLFSKSKLQLCISTSSWSEPFSLDTVGSYGCVRCPANNMDFLVGVGIQMSSFNLTRIVSMSPFFTVVNKTSYELEVGELINQSSVRWHYMSSTECVPLWPESRSGQLCVRVVGSDFPSRPFFFNKQDRGTLLKLDMCGGVIVEINIADHSSVISFSDYYEGSAPALVINHTPRAHISYRQSGSSEEHQLKPGQAQRFVWDNPANTRTLSWRHGETKGELDLLKDEVGQFAFDPMTQIHWVSFLDGRQRVLLFTEDLAVVTKARQAEELEQFEQEVKISLQNLGLSLVNNTSRQEIAYIGIPSSGVVWEMKPKNRWKPFSQKNINLLEKTYQSQLSGKSETGWVKLEGNMEVNLSGTNMMMHQPVKCPIRRNFLSGIQVEFKKSEHQRSLRAQLHWLQVDNQLPGAIFPIVFHPVPPPKSIALDSEPKPFIDVSIITRFNEHSSVMQFKYFMALVQEMAVKVDQGFLSAILALFTPAADPQADKQKSKLIEKDLQMLQPELMEASLTDITGLSFFEHFHISPIKLHLSLSLGSSGDDPSQEAAAVQSLNLLLKSIGATLTDVDDIIFKLAFFEVKYQFYSRDKLMWEVISHYSEQFLKQMYVLVLGLDVLGNPFGLIRGLSEGVEAFFYEPFQGAVQGPEEFAEGFVIGVRSLLGHTVGGAAGMVSKITGSVGKGLAAITMDKEYQQKRREEMNRPPKDFGESLAKGGKGLLKGVVGGVTGIVTKPMEGAKKEGAAGFFKGIGKGLVGVVARPTGGIVDMASSTFQGIQRVAESTEEVTKLRPVRLIREDGIIRPYDLSESKGYDLFQRSEIKPLEGEVFRDQSSYPGHRKTNIIVTNRRVVCVKELDFVNHFNKEWECLYENFYRPPEVHGTDLKIYCKESMKLKLPKKDGEQGRTVHLKDELLAQKLHSSICAGQMAQQQHRMSRQLSTRFLKPAHKH